MIKTKEAILFEDLQLAAVHHILRNIDAKEYANYKRILREIATERVLAVRGANDVPGFDLCVEAEMKSIIKEHVG